MPFPLAHWLVTYGIGFILLAMFIRVIASWFRMDERFAIIRFLARITDPFLIPARRLMRPVGVIDLSWIVTWFMLQTVQLLLLQSLPPTW